jgi:hypothetical protein
MTSGQDAALAALAQAFPSRAIVVIGATALAWHYPDFRGTLDLDVCVAIDAAEHARDEVLPTTWRRQRGMPHRWRTDDGLLIDVLPACDRLLADYVAEDDPRRFDEPELGDREWSDRPAFLLGIDLRAVASERHRGRIREFVRRMGDPARHDRPAMWKDAPSAWRIEADVPQRRLRSLCDGLGLP